MPVGRFMPFFCWLCVSCLLMMACSREPSTSRVSGEVRMRLPFPDDKGEVRLQEILLSGVENLLEMRGAYARFYFAPKLEPGGLRGEAARARFLRNHDGVYVPGDFVSQQMGALYAHFEKLSALDREVGAGQVVPWPRSVGVSVRLLKDDGALWTDNSFYDGASDAVLVVATTRRELPLSLNPGVIAHEHFHALFYHLVLRDLLRDGLVAQSMAGTAHDDPGLSAPVPDKEIEKKSEELSGNIKLQRALFLKAANEGLADVWGWIYSGQTDFVGRSLPPFKAARDLGRKGLEPLRSDNFRRLYGIWKNGGQNSGAALNNLSYLMGSDLARAVRQAFLDSPAGAKADQDPSRRKVLARRMIQRLPELAKRLRADAELKETGLDLIVELLTSGESAP
ncbi:MAG: hypothetical protein KF865_10580 [Bdellovibrionaceae bacterium]|nr:hypothetical protein [Pseudobdellovibrionaceae bacterium]